MLSKEYYIDKLKREYTNQIIHSICWLVGSIIFTLAILKYNFNREFYEQDPDLSYYSTNTDIVSDTNLYLINIIPVSIIIVIIFGLSKPVEFIDSKVKEVVYIVIIYFLTICTNILITEILKKFFGKPRPSIYYLCNYQGFRDGIQSNNLTQYYLLTNSHNLANTDLCWDQSALPNAVSSFPSGHTSFSFCSQTFLVVILNWLFSSFSYSVNYNIYCLSKLKFLSYIPLILAGWISISRIYDYKHNEVDLVGGFIIGCCIGYYGSNQVIDLYKKYDLYNKLIIQENISKNEFRKIVNIYNFIENDNV